MHLDASSLLNEVNLNQLVCSNIEEYKNLAIKKAKIKIISKVLKKNFQTHLKKLYYLIVKSLQKLRRYLY